MNRTTAAARRERLPVMLVSGEPSGDRIAAGVARVLGQRGVACFGMGGEASAAAGVAITAAVARPSMGLTEVATQLPRLLFALASLVRDARRRAPAAAVLIDYTEFNLQLGRRLRAMGVRVLWCVAPQVWAWRPSRAATVVASFDRLAVILPFERALWRAVGAEVSYVGHPALDVPPVSPCARAAARALLRIDGDGAAIALLPGSRPHEVRRHLGAMSDGVRQLGRERRLHVRLLLSGSLDRATRTWAARQVEPSEVVTIDPGRGAASALAGCDAAVVASGTATLESALAGAPPVVVYRASPLTAWAARRMLRVSHVALPNLLLDGAPYPELLQHELDAAGVARALAGVLANVSAFSGLPARLRAILSADLSPGQGPVTTTAERVAALLDDWLDPLAIPASAVARRLVR